MDRWLSVGGWSFFDTDAGDELKRWTKQKERKKILILIFFSSSCDADTVQCTHLATVVKKNEIRREIKFRSK